MTYSRDRFAGVLNILQYNRSYYMASVCALLAIGTLLWFRLLPSAGELVLIGAAALIGFWSLSSLLVSYYIYDYAGVTRWKWIPKILIYPPRQWLNIHAGLDESTPILINLFPNSGHMVLDIYNPREMTEPSIARARRLHPASQPAVACKLDALPIPDKDCDTLFLLFAAHEIRQSARRRELLLEAARVLADSGQLLLVEHLRDWKNFVAFGPGFLHFYSRQDWLRVAREAGLRIEFESRLTPFVRCFVMSKRRA